MDAIKVYVVEFGDRKHLQLQWRDPLSNKLKTKSSGVLKTAKRAHQLAQQKAGELAAQLEAGTFAGGRVPWEYFRDRYETDVLPSLAKNTASKFSTVATHLERELKIDHLQQLTADRISHFAAQLRKAGLAEATIKSILGTLKAALRWAERMGMLNRAPQITMPKRAGDRMKGRPLAGEELERMLAKVPAGIELARLSRKRRLQLAADLAAGKKIDPAPRRRQRPQDAAEQERAKARAAAVSRLLRGLWVSGLRLSEALNLWWDRDDRLCVDLAGRRPMLRIPAELEKGNKNRLLPITPDFAEFLIQTPEADRCGRVFAGVPGTRETVSRIIGAIGEAAGVKVRTKSDGTAQFATAHDFRRTFGERWAMRVMPAVLKELMRHENISTTMAFYVGQNAHRTADAVWEAFERAPNTSTNTGANSTPAATTENCPKSLPSK